MSNLTMPAVVQYGLENDQVELREMQIPMAGPNEVLVKVAAVGICGSEVHQWQGTHSWPVNIPVILGHEFGGTIVDLGEGVTAFKEGDRVVSETAARICSECLYCRTGNYNMCPKRSGFGYGTHGAMTQYVNVPTRCLHRVPDGLALETAALTEPCSVAYNAVVKHGNIKPGDSVLVLGPGPIGLLCLMMAKLCGATTVVMAGLSSDAKRFEVAKQVGATHILDLQAQDPKEFTVSIGDGYGFDTVIDAAGASAAIKTSIDLVRPMGDVIKVGWGPQPLNFSIDPLVQKAVTLKGSFSHNYPIWEKVLSLLASGQLEIAPLVGLKSGLEGWREGFEGMHHGKFAKAVLIP